MASIQQNGVHICNGVLISEEVVLTPAHCLRNPYETPYEKYSLDSLRVMVGSHFNHRYDERSIIYSHVKAIVEHPYYKYDNPNRDYDVVALYLDVSLERLIGSNSSVDLISLPDHNQTMLDLLDMQVYIVGWPLYTGPTQHYRADYSVRLQWANATSLTNGQCHYHFASYMDDTLNLTNRVFCTESSFCVVCYLNLIIVSLSIY